MVWPPARYDELLLGSWYLSRASYIGCRLVGKKIQSYGFLLEMVDSVVQSLGIRLEQKKKKALIKKKKTKRTYQQAISWCAS